MSTMQKLRALAIAAHTKIHENRFKDKTVKGKWEEGAHEIDGARSWYNCTERFLANKLREETAELLDAVHSASATSEEILREAGDVTAVAMMVCDHAGVRFHSVGLTRAPKVVCLCGSTKFGQAFIDANLRETLAGNIVLTIGCATHSDEQLGKLITPEAKKKLDELHKRKIDLADEILVLDVDGYIGSSTASEIAYAKATGKKISYLEDPLPF